MKQKLFAIGKILASAALGIALISGSSVLFAQTSGSTDMPDDEVGEASPARNQTAGAEAEPAPSTNEVTVVSDASGAEDTVLPSDVDIFDGKAGDGEVLLTWESATDNLGVTGYKIYSGTHSVQSQEDMYDMPVTEVEGSAARYVMKNLVNGRAYYFSITAVDAAGNESFNWAPEISLTPNTGLHFSAVEDDARPPQVKEIKAEDVVTVLVTFSEPVKYPEEHPETAFQIEKGATKTRLGVQSAKTDPRDESGKTILLTTAPQEEGADYVFTAGIEIEDLLGNPVVSGTSDTGAFKGSPVKPQPKALPEEPETPEALAPSDTEGPAITGATADYNNQISVNFSEAVRLAQSAKDQITIIKKGTTQALGVFHVSLSVDSKTVYLTTALQEPVEYEVKVGGVRDLAGNIITADASMVTVTGKAAGLIDLVPPEDVEKLVARVKSAKDHIVELRWAASKNSAGDLNDQVLYQSAGRKGKDFNGGTSLGTSTTALEVQDLSPGQWYTFKMTAKDFTGNESKGALASVFLPQTGPGAVAAGLTSLIMGWYARRKRRKD